MYEYTNSRIHGCTDEGAPETIDGEEYFVPPLNPPETSSGQAPPAGRVDQFFFGPFLRRFF